MLCYWGLGRLKLADGNTSAAAACRFAQRWRLLFGHYGELAATLAFKMRFPCQGSEDAWSLLCGTLVSKKRVAGLMQALGAVVI